MVVMGSSESSFRTVFQRRLSLPGTGTPSVTGVFVWTTLKSTGTIIPRSRLTYQLVRYRYPWEVIPVKKLSDRPNFVLSLLKNPYVLYRHRGGWRWGFSPTVPNHASSYFETLKPIEFIFGFQSTDRHPWPVIKYHGETSKLSSLYISCDKSYRVTNSRSWGLGLTTPNLRIRW